MVEVNKSMVLEFVKALESGKYQQTRGALHRIEDDGPCFCAVGVACDLFKDRLGMTVSTDLRFGLVGYNGAHHGVPSSLKSELPIDWEYILQLNDFGIGDGPWSFERIAKWLRKEYLDDEA